MSAWVDFLLDRLMRSPSPALAAEVATECLSPAFQRLLPCMRPSLSEALADGLAEHVLPQLEEASQKRLLDGLGEAQGTPLLPQRIEEMLMQCTEVRKRDDIHENLAEMHEKEGRRLYFPCEDVFRS